MRQSAPQIPGETKNEHASILSKGADAVMWFLGTAIAMLILCVILLPLVTGFMGKSDRLLAAYQRAATLEGSIAAAMAPEVKLGNWVLLEEAWTYKAATNAARSWIPQDKEAGFLQDKDVAKAKQQEQANAINPPSESAVEGQPQPRMENAAAAGLSQKANTWLTDRFWPVLRSITVVGVSRGLQALELLIIFLPIVVCAYFWGEYVARERERQGVTPLGHRYRIWMKVAMVLIPSFPVVIITPVPFPGFVALLAMYIGLVWSIGLARSHITIQL